MLFRYRDIEGDKEVHFSTNINRHRTSLYPINQSSIELIGLLGGSIVY